MPLSSAPRSIIGRRIRVHWPDDDEWWFGIVENYTSRRGWKVSYEKVDGEDMIGELLKSLYDTRKAAHNWEELAG